jgi:hypothetical protein
MNPEKVSPLLSPFFSDEGRREGALSFSIFVN